MSFGDTLGWGSTTIVALFVAAVAFAANLADKLGALGESGVTDVAIDASSITPALVRGLPDALREAVQLAYHESLMPVFLIMVPVFVVALILVALLRNRPLSEKNE